VPGHDDLYEAGRQALQSAFTDLKDGPVPTLSDQTVERAISLAMSSPDKVQRYGLVGQTLLKIVDPEVSAWLTNARTPRARAFVRNTLPDFETSSLDNLIGGSNDPYVSNPFRPPRQGFDRSQAEGAMAPHWEAMFQVLDFLDAHPDEAGAVLRRALSAALERRQPFQVLITNVLHAQSRWKTDPAARALRKETVENLAPTLLLKHLPSGFAAEGSAEMGTQAEVPWFRVYSPLLSPSAQLGYYIAYVFAADGSSAFLCLMSGTEKESALQDRVQWARIILGPRPEFQDHIDLHSVQKKPNSRPRLYEKGSIYARQYDIDVVPSESDLLADLQSMAALLERLYSAVRETEGDRDITSLTVAAVEEQSKDLILPEGLVAAAVAELRAGHHLLLVGVPGTGKTAFAQALALAAVEAGLATDWVLTTATSDWTTIDTVGGYRLERANGAHELRFRPGLVLNAIDQNKWVIIDELNRADIDKSLGQLFTVLSGFPVTLPFVLEVGDKSVSPSIVPAGSQTSEITEAFIVKGTWRLIATLNTRDRDLLFNMSYALMRRFAVVEIGVPSDDDFDVILQARGSSGSSSVDACLRQLGRLPGRPIGPAIVLNCLDFARERLAVDPAVETAQLLSEALVAHVLPQLDDLSRQQQRALVAHAFAQLLQPWPLGEVLAFFSRQLQVPEAELTPPRTAIASAGTSASSDHQTFAEDTTELEGLLDEDVRPS
jgi:MoxR-like ATPase